MEISFSPTPADVERYRRLRALGRVLSQRIVETIPPRAYDEIADTLGMLRQGVVVLDTADMTGVLADSCIYDWFQGGKNVVQQYAEAHPAKPGSDEAYLLDAYGQAKYGILMVRSAVPDAGVYCYDAINRQELFIMDQSLSRSLGNGRAAIATRIVCLGEYWMTGGAVLPIHSADAIEPAIAQLDQALTLESRDGPAAFPTLMIRACLDAGAAEHVEYTGMPEKLKERPRMPSWPGSKRRRRPS